MISSICILSDNISKQKTFLCWVCPELFCLLWNNVAPQYTKLYKVKLIAFHALALRVRNGCYMQNKLLYDVLVIYHRYFTLFTYRGKNLLNVILDFEETFPSELQEYFRSLYLVTLDEKPCKCEHVKILDEKPCKCEHVKILDENHCKRQYVFSKKNHMKNPLSVIGHDWSM